VTLLAGAKAARGTSSNAWNLSEALCLAPPPGGPSALADHWGALLAGRVLVECADLDAVSPRNLPKLERVRDWQINILRQHTLPASERALAGRSLAVLGDSRPEVMTLESVQFCFIPPGPFQMGDDQGADEEKPQHRVELDYPYGIARYPVTQAQWQAYLDSSRLPEASEQRKQRRPNEPVVEVSWHQAREFCRFLSQTCHKHLSQGRLRWWPSTIQASARLSARELQILLWNANPKSVELAEDWRRVA
jgi:hypothetical protein